MLGVSSISYRFALGSSGASKKKNENPLNAVQFLEKAKSIGLDGVEMGITLDEESLKAIRRKAEELNMYVGIVCGKPTQPMFEKIVEGGEKIQCSHVSAYLDFLARPNNLKSFEEVRAFIEKSKKDLAVAEKIGRKHKVKIAIENHLDFTADEFVEIMNEVGSEYLGICLDTANGFWTVEDPVEVVQKLAPYAYSTHFKDGRVRWTSAGYVEDFGIPMGQGHVNLPKIVSILKKAKTDLNYTIECVTGQTITLPWLDEEFWNTFKQRDAWDLARILRLIRDTPTEGWKPVLDVEKMSVKEHLEYEDSNVRACAQYARKTLNL